MSKDHTRSMVCRSFLAQNTCDNTVKLKYDRKISTKREARLYGLDKNRVYFIRVRAENYAGLGDASDPIPVTYFVSSGSFPSFYSISAYSIKVKIFTFA